MNEYGKRLINPKPLCLYRHAPKRIHRSFVNSSHNEICVETYCFVSNRWYGTKTALLGARRYEFGSIFVNEELFVLGGRDADKDCYANVSVRNIICDLQNYYISLDLIQVELYNVKNSTRTTLPSMKSCRAKFTPISVGKYIYAFGGYQCSQYGCTGDNER